MRFCPMERSQGWKRFFRVRVKEEYEGYKEFRSRP
jgi:hypothetical protein